MGGRPDQKNRHFRVICHPLRIRGGGRMVWNIICLPSPLLKQEGGGGRLVDGLLRVAEIRTERRMEPADEGEGIYRFASVGKF